MNLRHPFTSSGRRASARRLALWALAVAAVGFGWLQLAPQQLGGPASYAIVSGSSMEPHLHRGDLVVLHVRPSYHVGDVVAYHSRELRRNVVHRIREIRGDRYVFKGDNNSFLDAERPNSSQLIGQLWLRIPSAGHLVELLRRPAMAGVVAVLIVLLTLGAPAEARRRRGSSAPAPLPAAASPRGLRLGLADDTRRTVMVSLGGAGVLCALLALLAFTRPTTTLVPGTTPAYEERGTFDYSAAASNPLVYSSGRASSGQPLFVKLVKQVDFRFRFHFASPRRHAVAGTATLAAVLTDGAGWKRVFPLQVRTPFVGDTIVLRGSLRVPALRSLIDRFQAATGVVADSYQLTVGPRVALQGTVNGQELHDVFAPPLTFRLDPYRLQLETGAPGAPPNTLHRSRTGTQSQPGPARLSLPLLKPTVSTARVVGAGGAFAVLLALLVVALLSSPSRGEDEAAMITRRYGDVIVPVAARRRPNAATAVRVASMESLVRIADRYERMILHEFAGGIHTFLVEDSGSHYFYETRAGTPPCQPPETEGLRAEPGLAPGDPAQNELERRRRAAQREASRWTAP